MVRASNNIARVDDFTVIKEGDTVNKHVLQLLNRDGTPKDLTGATVTWIMANEKGVVLSKSANVTDAVNGTVSLEVAESENTGSGVMRVEIKVDTVAGVEKFPGHGYYKINISPSLENIASTPVAYTAVGDLNLILSALTTEGEAWEV